MQLLITMSIIILHNCNFSIELIIIEVLRPGNMFYKIYFTFLHDILINTLYRNRESKFVSEFLTPTHLKRLQHQLVRKLVSADTHF